MLIIYFKLLLAFLKIGALSIGGGYGSISIIYSEVVLKNRWISQQEFLDILTIAEMTPGPIAINSATFVGMKIADLFGAVVATIGCVVIPFVVVILLSKLYEKTRESSFFQHILTGLKSVVLALVLSVCITMLRLIFPIDAVEQIGIIDMIIKFLILSCNLYLIKYKESKPIKNMLLSGLFYGLFRAILY